MDYLTFKTTLFLLFHDFTATNLVPLPFLRCPADQGICQGRTPPCGCSGRRGRWVALGARGSASRAMRAAFPGAAGRGAPAPPGDSAASAGTARQRSRPLRHSSGSLEGAEWGAKEWWRSFLRDYWFQRGWLNPLTVLKRKFI